LLLLTTKMMWKPLKLNKFPRRKLLNPLRTENLRMKPEDHPSNSNRMTIWEITTRLLRMRESLDKLEEEGAEEAEEKEEGREEVEGKEEENTEVEEKAEVKEEEIEIDLNRKEVKLLRALKANRELMVTEVEGVEEEILEVEVKEEGKAEAKMVNRELMATEAEEKEEGREEAEGKDLAEEELIDQRQLKVKLRERKASRESKKREFTTENLTTTRETRDKSGTSMTEKTVLAEARSWPKEDTAGVMLEQFKMN
jgi:hypothetical protein